MREVKMKPVRRNGAIMDILKAGFKKYCCCRLKSRTANPESKVSVIKPKDLEKQLAQAGEAPKLI
jgi:hypothetical protein